MPLSEQEQSEIIAKVGRPRARNGGKIALDVERIRAMRAAGFSLRQIADYFDVGRSTVRRRLRERESGRAVPHSSLATTFWSPLLRPKTGVK